MGYVFMTTYTLYEVFRRWQAGQRASEIAAGVTLDRKTVRKYAHALAAVREPDFETALPVLSRILKDLNRRPSKDAFAELGTYREQIVTYLTWGICVSLDTGGKLTILIIGTNPDCCGGRPNRGLGSALM